LKNIYGKKKPYSIVKTFMGKCLVGANYIPPFKYYVDNHIFTIVGDTFVDNTNGTGIVHLAPAFGQEDFRVCVEY